MVLVVAKGSLGSPHYSGIYLRISNEIETLPSGRQQRKEWNLKQPIIGFLFYLFLPALI